MMRPAKKEGACCGLDMKCPLKVHVFKAWSTIGGTFRDDWIMRVITSSMD
jgi:hypothetical protein